MTLQDLIEELSALPVSARTAPVSLCEGDCNDLEIVGISYQMGEVVIACDQRDEDDEDDD